MNRLPSLVCSLFLTVSSLACEGDPGTVAGTGGTGTFTGTPGSGGTVSGEVPSGQECDPACATGQTCVEGSCSCSEGLSACSTGCVDLQSDGRHCGACETPCTDGLVCSQRTCSDQCATGLTECGTSCVDVQTNVQHCGTCDNACPSGSCVGGQCEQTSTDDPTDPSADCSEVTDDCPMSSGLEYACVKRFALGINYAWHDFATDFGGLEQWEQSGVAADSATYSSELAEMKNNGAGVIRWWMFPDFRGDGVQFDDNDDPTGLSSQAVTDIQTALDLAEAQDVYLVFTIFSFDNFRPTHTDSGVTIRGMAPMVQDATRRSKLIENVVRPIAQAVAASPNSHRVMGWDIINEPEWAVEETDGAPSGEQFTPDEELTPVSLTEMQALINESAAVLNEETDWALLTVGWAAAKWAWAFADMAALDFEQPHIYAWVNDWWPYTSSPSDLGYSRPTVMGEFFLESMPFSGSTDATYDEILSSWYDNGYAGAWAWQYIENQSNLGLIDTFSQQHSCETAF